MATCLYAVIKTIQSTADVLTGARPTQKQTLDTVTLPADLKSYEGFERDPNYQLVDKQRDMPAELAVLTDVTHLRLQAV